MNPIKYINSHLSSRAATHLIIFAGSLLFVAIFEIIFRGTPFTALFFLSFCFVFSQVEVFYWLGRWRFSKPVKHKSTNELVWKTFRRVIIFFTVFLYPISAAIYLIFMYLWFLVNGYDLHRFFNNIMNDDAKKFIVIGNSIGALFGLANFFFFSWFDTLKREQKLREEKLLFQYETLKNQVNPHFLFNSLNTLSSLVGSNSELAEKFIQKLSTIYRFVLEYRETELIDLSLEIGFVNDYFFLQQIRDENRISLSIEVKDLKYKILPISLQILVENALKHNSATLEKPLKISILQDNNTIAVRNNLQRKTVMESSKSGLNNLRERVRYITGKEMIVNETQNEFKVIVPLVK